MYATRGGPLRLVKSLRGSGTLMWGQRGTRPVTYSIDLYSQGQLLSGDGDMQGELKELVGKTPANLRLRLASGDETPIQLRGGGADMASIELVGPVSPTLLESTN